MIFEPTQLGSQLWTKNTTCYVYAGIEKAYLMAGNVPGKDRSGQASELRALLKWIDEQLDDPKQPIPKNFIQETMHLFRRSYLEDRRNKRKAALLEISASRPNAQMALLDLRNWVCDDLARKIDGQMGSPEKYHKTVFAVEIVSLWNVLTGKNITRGPDTVFARFLAAC